MLLHKAIYEVTNQFGIEVIQNETFVNYLADYNAFESVKPAKMILKAILKSGYGRKIYALDLSNKYVCQSRMKRFVSEVVAEHGFQESYVNYVFDCISYGLGLTKYVLEPKENSSSGSVGISSNDRLVLLKQRLNECQIEYTSILNSLLEIPRSYISKSAYFKPGKHAELYSLEIEIKSLYNELGRKYDQWCDNERNRILRPYNVSSGKKAKQIFFKIGVPIVIVVILSLWGLSYANSSDSIAAFDEQMENASILSANGNYGQAISSFLNAGSNYDGSYSPSQFKGKATEKAEESFKKLRNQCISEFEKGNYLSVQEVIGTIPDDYLIENPEKKEWVKETLDAIEDETTTRIAKLAKLIGDNHGKLNAEGKELLDELLKVSPSNYWLNFIKNKEK